MARRRHKVKFIEKKHSVRGIISSVIAAVAILLTAYVTYRTTRSGGHSTAIAGLAGLGILGMNLIGVVTASLSFKQKEIYYTWSIVGLVVNGVMLLAFVFLYFLGLSI